jgi:Tfp pilus assembly protein PilE
VNQSTTREASTDAGETLVEIIISILVMSIIFVAVRSGFATNVSISAIHKHQATEQTIARDFGEYLQDASVGYSSGCAADYSSAINGFKTAYELPDAAKTKPLADGTYAIRIDSVKYLVYPVSGPSRSVSYSADCADEQGAQLISYTVFRPSDASATSPEQSLQVVKHG